MKLLLQFAMIFFGTLLAAGLLALGEPASAPSDAARYLTGAAGATDNSAWQEITAAAQAFR